MLKYLAEKDQEYNLYSKINTIHLIFKMFVHLYLFLLYFFISRGLFKNTFYKNQRYIWLLIQHCDEDVKLQQKYLSFFIEKKIQPKYIAFLTDRIGVNTIQKQLYGTQWIETNNNFLLYPIDSITVNDIDSYNLRILNINREQMGLNDVEEDASILLKHTNIQPLFMIYNLNLNLQSDITIRKIRDITDYKYLK